MNYSQELSKVKRQIEEDIYRGSEFEWYRNLSSKRKGRVGELMVGDHFQKMGMEVYTSKEARTKKLVDKSVRLSDYDLYIKDLEIRAEVKTSTIWGNTNSFKFQQIREQEYDIIVFQFIHPDYVQLFYCTKEEAQQFIMIEGNGQHGGGDAEETSWISVTKDKIPAYMKPLNQLIATNVLSY